SVDVAVQRGDKILPMKLVPEPKGPERVGDVGLQPPEVVGTVEPDQPAAKAGIQVGDILLSVDGTHVQDTDEVQKVLARTQSKPVQVVVWRDGKELSFTITPAFTNVPSQGEKWRIGFLISSVERLPFGDAFRSSLQECKTNSLLIFKLLGKMIEQPRT